MRPILFGVLIWTTIGNALGDHTVIGNYGKLPLRFELNAGQFDPQVRFLARGPRYRLFLTTDAAVLEWNATQVLRLRLADSDPEPVVTGLGELPGRANYFVGNKPAGWRTDVPQYQRVRYAEVYPGIDLVYYGNQRQLEHDFVVGPGADPAVITWLWEGADRLRVDEQGELVICAGHEELRWQPPVVYQVASGVRERVACRYELRGEAAVGFLVGAYDRTRPLVIDPVLAYGTHLGGSGSDKGYGIAVDNTGSAYVVGVTGSTDFPTTPGAYKAFGVNEAFVTKLDPTGAAPIYSTYLGPGIGEAIAVDAAGNAYVTGVASSSFFPTTIGAFQALYGGNGDAFVLKLNPAGNTLLYSTLIGGSTDEEPRGLAVDGTGHAYITGRTQSSAAFAKAYPTTVGAFQTAFGGSTYDAFVTKVNPTGTALVYSTFLGGDLDDVGSGIAVDLAGNAYVAGSSASTNFPTLNAFQQPDPFPNEDAFVTKLNPTGTMLVYSTMLGGDLSDDGYAIALNAAGHAFVAGVTVSANFPTTPGAFQPESGGFIDAFVTQFTPAGDDVVYSTYFGGTDRESASGGLTYTIAGVGLAVDAADNVYLCGETRSTNMPVTVGAPQPSIASAFSDAFVSQLAAGGSNLLFSTYLGGTHQDLAHDVALDTNGNLYVVGETTSTNFPTTVGAFDTTLGGAGVADAFVVKYGTVAPPASFNLGVATTEAPDPVAVNEFLTYTVTVTNTGPGTALAVVLTNSLSPNVTFSSADGCTAVGNIVRCELGALGSGASISRTVVVITASAGIATNVATVSGKGIETAPANNTATITTTITAGPPPNQPPVAICRSVVTNAGASCNASLPATAFDDGSFDTDGTITGRAISPTGPFAPGLTQVVLTVTDDDGATSVCTTTVTVADNTLPSITCPATIVTNVPNGVTSAVVTFPAASVSDNCSVASTNYVPPSGSSFPLGTNLVTRTAVDGGGNTNTCQFTVIVAESPPVPRDLAVLSIKAPKKVTLKEDVPPKPGKLSIAIQNLGDQSETIANENALRNLLNLLITSLGGCDAPVATLVPPKTGFPILLAPKKKLTIAYTVAIDCANDPLATSKTEDHSDYRYTVTLDLSALNGETDTQPGNNDCPRPASGADKGCGNKDPITKQVGADVLTDVIVK